MRVESILTFNYQQEREKVMSQNAETHHFALCILCSTVSPSQRPFIKFHQDKNLMQTPMQTVQNEFSMAADGI